MNKELEANTNLSHYRIVSKIGAGGMGEVYLAEDTRLKRKVALKVLPETLASDTDRLLRFEREAFAASALNHPNILTIFEFAREGDTHFLASEFVTGETLRDRIGRADVTVSATLEITLQIASALQAAHAAGIIHRDIKPENVMIREDGYVKVLDFGLAKLLEQTPLDAEAATRMQLQTQAGMIMGTVAYMSPEQARGMETDARTDIFSLGVVLYEMLARRQPFTGETINHTIVAILEKEPPPVSGVVGDCPSEVERIVQKALAKERAQRYQSAQELSADLKDAKQELEFQSRLERTASRDRKTEEQTQIIRAATTAEEKHSTSKTQSGNSIAVMPFTNMSADEDNEYFCDGLAEELLNALSKIEDLKVAARTSAFSFKGKNANISEIGEKLNVKNVLEGSVRRSGNKLRISVQLISAADGYHLWSERYDREMKDIFDVQDEITLAVIDALKLELLGDEKAAVLKRYTENQEVYQLYLKGRFFWNKRTDESLRKAVGYFQQAIEIDPNYALAHAGLADSYFYLGYNFGFMPPDEAMPKAISAARTALELDKNLGEAYCSSGLVKLFYEWDLAGAAEDLQSSIALNPHYPLGYHIYGFYLAAIHGKFDEAIVEAKKALNLEPLSIPLHNIVALLLLDARHYDEAIPVWRKAIEIVPNNAGLCSSSFKFIRADSSVSANPESAGRNASCHRLGRV
jgi:serine/threonine-protein kinase